MLIAQHPTNVIVQDARFQRWVGVDEELLTLRIFNDSDTPALRFRVLQPNPERLPRKPGLFLHEKQLTIEAHRTLEVPVATRSQMMKLAAEENGSAAIVGAGVAPDLPDSLQAALCKDVTSQAEYSCQTVSHSIPFGLELQYSTIFDERKTLVRGLFLYTAERVAHSEPALPALDHSELALNSIGG